MKKTLFLTFLMIFATVATSLVFSGCSRLELANPENIRYDGTTITWNAVENADSYTVRINDGAEYTVTAASYAYDARDMQFNVTIKAVSRASKIVQSGETVKTLLPLASVSEVRVANDGSVSWDAVQNATGYLVKIDGIELPQPIAATSYSDIGVGTHSIQVRPVVATDSSYYSKWSSIKSVNILNSVSKDSISYSNGVISWNYVSGAACYEISINGSVVTSECSTTQWTYDAQNRDFEAAIKAIGNRLTNFDAKTSETKKFIYLDTITNLTVEDGKLHWAAISGADGYKIKLNGIEQSVVLSEPLFDKLTANVATEVSIKPLCNDNTYFSDWSVAKSVLILSSPVLKWNSDYELDGQANSNAYWDGVTSAAGYAVRLTLPNGTERITSYGETQRYFQEAYLQVGEYKIEVKSVAPTTASNTFDSVYSTPIIVTRLSSPKAASNGFITSDPTNVSAGFTVTFTSVAGASGYLLYCGNTEVQRSITNQFAVSNVIGPSVTEQQTLNYTIQSVGQVKTVSGRINAILSSLTSEALPFEISVLATPQNTNMSGFVYSYGEISGSNGYVIDVQGQSYTSNNTSYSLELLEAGTYAVSVCARGNGAAVLPSNYSAPITVQRLAAPTNIHIETSDASEGILGYDTVLHASGYHIIFNNDGNALPVENMMNVNQYITEQGTVAHMISSANYFNDNRTIYYMTSQSSTTANFIKLSTPTFGDVAFSNTQLIWNAPANINTQIYTPTYEIYYANGTLYNGEKNGTTMDIAYLEGGAQYTFYVKAIGNGTNYVNSAKTQPITIWKLSAPMVNRGEGNYTWSGVTNAVSYTVYVDGKLAATYAHETGKTYSFTPSFDELKTYNVEVYAIGDGGYTSIDSVACSIKQETAQLSTPDFSLSYSDDCYALDGTVDVTITQTSPYATGYSYTVGGSTSTSTSTTYSHTPSSVGTFTVRVYAIGGAFDENGVYYLDSQSRGGNSNYSITLLATPNQSSITLTADGYMTWTSIADAVGYEIEISVDGGEYGEVITVNNQSYYTFEDFEQYQGKQLKVRIRAKGNGTNIITSESVEHTWNNL